MTSTTRTWWQARLPEAEADYLAGPGNPLAGIPDPGEIVHDGGGILRVDDWALRTLSHIDPRTDGHITHDVHGRAWIHVGGGLTGPTASSPRRRSRGRGPCAPRPAPAGA